ncbi:sulfite exporter TauE/SafE family protein [Clostridium magnum]|uniref:Probable membrane transporter protein n=1 Tax=Clostridium magnum DSM 2767 TaxID=1121326 RepID=A0A162QZD8_9CLOT|nr:sulfite exporter TauE/SafE family protein [Clostridium magnum]KZL89187.1 sulfite exporter TauE/SafE [Clostridium magnum DSM 2767]SHJ24215.1 hypothetical protein SAMN02745944_05589 [Clostridium magnum DSM 2767]
MEVLSTFNLSMWQWSWMIVCALLVGFSKSGISGFLIPVIPIVAAIFGAKLSTGIILPVLIVGDVFAIYYYKQHADWNKIKKLLPWTLVGLISGVIVGNYINDTQFKIFIAICVLVCLIILIYTEKKGEKLNVPSSIWFYALMGILSGFASMIGNAAGALFNIYLLAMRFEKNDFIGTTAWFFFIVNISKVPLQILFWHNISFDTIFLTTLMIPAVAAGAMLGVLVVKKINEKYFRILINIMTVIGSIKLLI